MQKKCFDNWIASQNRVALPSLYLQIGQKDGIKYNKWAGQVLVWIGIVWYALESVLLRFLLLFWGIRIVVVIPLFECIEFQ